MPIDAALYDALRKQGAKLAAAIQEATILKGAADLVKDTTTDELKALGANTAQSRVCVQSGSALVDSAFTRIVGVLNAGAALQGKPS
ncbi:MAG: hypothetical protein NVSMB47_17470 [Polyangiales bacterium]